MPLLPDTDWSKIGCIVVYCEEFYADLGDLTLDAPLINPNPPSTTTAPTPTPTTSSTTSSTTTYGTVNDLPNCAELIPGYYNLHWGIEGENITLGLEGRPGGVNRWMGFGFSEPGTAGPQMIGSNVIVAGMIKNKCFAYNYLLSSQSQCDYATADGACPDFAGTQPLAPSTAAALISCEKMGDTYSFLLTRPIGASDDKNNAWPMDGSQYSVFAMGPVSEGSNSTIPVVLYHNLQLPGMPSAMSVSASMEKPVKLNLSAAGKNCRQIVSKAEAPGAANGPAPAGGKVATISGPTKFNITIGSKRKV